MNSLNACISTLSIVLIFSFGHYAQAANIDKVKAKVSNCLGCHGSKSPQYPSLAGQTAAYIRAQLQAFQSGKRSNSMMQSMTAKLSKQDINDFSAYFSRLKPESAGTNDPALVKKGQAKIAMCQGCHGSSLQGRGNFPRLAGQKPEYLKKQLLNFKNRSRKGGLMNAISDSLSEQDINEIVAYLGGL